MRDGRLDFFKGLLIWSVVLGHCLNVACPGTILHTVLRTFDLPMFMYISGYLMRKSVARYDWKQLILNKLTCIVFPAVIWIIISLLFGDLHSYYFLWAVFFSSVTVCMCKKIDDHMSISGALGGAIIIIPALFFYFIPINIFNMSYLFPFFLIGYFSDKIGQVGWSKGIFSLVLFIFLIAFVWKPDYSIWSTGSYVMHNTKFILWVIMLRLIIGLAGIYSSVFVLSLLYEKFVDSAAIHTLSSIGKQTLAIYMIQHIVVEIGFHKLVMYLNIYNFLKEYAVIVGYALTPMLSLLLLYVMYRIALIINKHKSTKWLLGFRIEL